jgi:hypothetical protein
VPITYCDRVTFICLDAADGLDEITTMLVQCGERGSQFHRNTETQKLCFCEIDSCKLFIFNILAISTVSQPKNDPYWLFLHEIAFIMQKKLLPGGSRRWCFAL